MVKSTTAERPPLWKRLLEILFVCFVFLVTIVVGFIVFRIVYEQPPEDMIKIADRFTPGQSWQLVADHIEPKRVLCFDIACPSIWRRWLTDATVTKVEFEQLLHGAGWNFNISGDCVLNNVNDFSDHIEVCSASGLVDSYVVDISVESSNPLGKSWIGLNIEHRSST